MQVQVPIMGFVPPKSQAADLIRRLDLGYSITDKEGEGIFGALDTIYLAYKSGGHLWARNKEAVAKFEYKALTKHLTCLCNEIGR
jgi:hypothetical protein